MFQAVFITFLALLTQLQGKVRENIRLRSGKVETTVGGQQKKLQLLLRIRALCREEGGEAGRGKGSGLGHGTGLLVIDVAAHTTGVDAWKNHRDSSGSQGQAED